MTFSDAKAASKVNNVVYFAYGSNMSLRRLKARVPSVEKHQLAKLKGYQLCFHKRSLDDGSAKCDALYSGNKTDVVWGVVFRLPSAALTILDRIEGEGYDRVSLEVETEGGEKLQVISYLANCIDATLLPFDWYKQHVLTGAREADLPVEYIAQIEAVATQTDPDQARSKKERSIYL
jgi:gamma-glutamylcyclotransferase (GGCT)/AIG2-like uncharacterized protein YtfP